VTVTSRTCATPEGDPVPTGYPTTVLGFLYRTAGAAALADLPDADLLRRFTAGSGAAEAAFTALVRRHGPVVLRACRAVVPDSHAPEACFRAPSVVPAPKPRSLAPRPLGPGLSEAARRVALRARSAAARRRSHERRAARPVAQAPASAEPDLAAV